MGSTSPGTRGPGGARAAVSSGSWDEPLSDTPVRQEGKPVGLLGGEQGQGVTRSEPVSPGSKTQALRGARAR